MFDIGFTEFLLVAVVGLLVVGPKQLPGAIRGALIWVRMAKKGFDTIKASLEEEIGVDEIRSQLRKDSIITSFEEQADQLEALDNEIQQANIDLMDSLSFSEERK